MISELLSEIELYYLQGLKKSDLEYEITGAEHHHIVHVMKHTTGGIIHVTDGVGNLYECTLLSTDKKSAVLSVRFLLSKPQRFPTVWFCLPLLKSSDRMEFCLEKLVELGFANFLYYRAKRSVSQSKRFPEERMEKIAIAAMQQSLNLWRPTMLVDYGLETLRTVGDGQVIVFEAVGGNSIETLSAELIQEQKIPFYLLFGPEGGLTPEEMNKFPGARITRLTKNRLRAETAALYTGSVLSSCLENMLQ